MALATGTKLGSYEVVGQIGAGGMGEVYQAHDTKLGRDVAIKVLPEAFAHDHERLSRFQREAKMLAALNHTNIATIHGLEQSGDTSYLVMELVSGETLAERIKREGAVPVEEALAIAKQIAEALEAAHEKSIIHRDLKPANVKVTPEGKVKVLDFGLAKAFEGDATGEDIGNSPTLSMPATMQGVILGTAAYMSPEQARGKAVDKRTDLWAFGCVLYELLTGKAAFRGEDTTDILAAVVRAEPDMQALPAVTPVKIRDLLRRCLQKDKILRMQAAGDVRIEIHEALSMSGVTEPTADDSARQLRGWRLPALIGLEALVVAAVAIAATWYLKPEARKPVTRTVINLPPGDQLAALDSTAIAISPDGTQLAYVATHNGTRQIYLRALDSLELKPLSGTEGVDTNNPFYSPDGQWLGFAADGKLKKIPVGGGAAVTLCSAPALRGATWNNDGTIIFAPMTVSFLRQVSDAGGVPKGLTQINRGDAAHGWPELLPGNRVMLFAVGTVTDRIVAQSVSSGERRDIVPGGTAPHYAATGHLIYAQGGNLMAAPFDARRLQLTGAPVPVLEGVNRAPLGGGVQYALSSNGTLVYVPGENRVGVGERLIWVNRNGTEQALAAPPHFYVYPRISPDGRRAAVGVAEGDTQLWLYDFARETLSRFTFEGAQNYNAAWAPDGKRIAFFSDKEGPLNIFWQPADGSGGMERLTTNEYSQVPRSFSPDGQLLSYVEVNPTTGYDIWVLRVSDHKTEPLLRTPFNESVPAFSPDGHWLAYVSDESDRMEIYVRPYPGPGGKYQISTDGGTEPVWNPNGKELFYRQGNKMMAVDITVHPTFSSSKPKMLFQGPYVPTRATFPYYDVSPDGQRFLMIKLSEQTSTPTQIVVVQNWFEELKRRVPTGTK